MAKKTTNKVAKSVNNIQKAGQTEGRSKGSANRKAKQLVVKSGLAKILRNK